MTTENIDEFIQELIIAEKQRGIAELNLSQSLFRLATFLSRIDVRFVLNVAIDGYIAPLPLELSPATLYTWKFYKQGAVRACISTLKPSFLGDEECALIFATEPLQEESKTLLELFQSRASRKAFGNMLRKGELKHTELQLKGLSESPTIRLQELQCLEEQLRSRTYQLGSLSDHKYDWPSRGVTRAKVRELALKEALCRHCITTNGDS